MRRVISIVALALLVSVGVNATTESPVADAAARGDRDAVKSLLKQASDVNAAQGDGMTALHWAAMNGDADLAQMLIVAGANVKATTRLGAYTPLYLASQQGRDVVALVEYRHDDGKLWHGAAERCGGADYRLSHRPPRNRVGLGPRCSEIS